MGIGWQSQRHLIQTQLPNGDTRMHEVQIVAGGLLIHIMDCDGLEVFITREAWSDVVKAVDTCFAEERAYADQQALLYVNEDDDAT